MILPFSGFTSLRCHVPGAQESRLADAARWVVHFIFLAACCLVAGHVEGASGAPVAGAHISLRGPQPTDTTSDAKGDFKISATPGDYLLDASARGFVSASVDLQLSHDSTVKISLEPLDAPTLRTIAAVTVDGRLAPIRGAIPSITLTRNDMAQMGDTLAIDGLQTLPGTTFAHPDGGGSNAITVAALRGPDPSESLIALDGQLLNDGNTGDLDLSRIPLSALSSLNVTEGLGPEDSNGSNTFGGAINFVSLRPTATHHFSLATSGGSFGQSEAWINDTGTKDKLGYAFALDNSHQGGYVNQYENVYAPGCTKAPCPSSEAFLGSAVAAHMALANLTYTFSQTADLNARVFVLGDIRDQGSTINGIDANPADKGLTFGQFVGPGDQTFAQNIRAYQLRGRTNVGAGELTTDLSESDNDIGINGNVSNPAYDVTHLDKRSNLGMTWERQLDTSDIAIGGYTRYESLQFLAPAPSSGTVTASQAQPLLGQSINVLFARGGFQATKELHLDAGLFDSHYTSFGSNLDGRLAAIYNTDPTTAVRFSLGSGFRAPLLIERYVFPTNQLAVDSNGVLIGQGNPGERPEHATEYELGVSHQFASATFDFSLYRTNLRNPIEIYYPYGQTVAGTGGATTCNGASNGLPIPNNCVSYNSNIGNAVYQGIEVRFVQKFVPQHIFLTAMYGLNVAYPKDLTSDFSNPTSGTNLVDNQQFGNIPQQQGSIELDYAPDNWHAGMNAIFQGSNNGLNQGPFAIVNASIGFKINSESDITLAGTNLFNGGTSRYTMFGQGVPYPGSNGPILTNRYGIEPFGFRFVFTMHM